MEAMTNDRIKDELKEIIVKKLSVNIAKADIDDAASLYEDGIGLDSIAVVSFIVQIEKTFGFTFEESEISTELFENINTIAGFIATRLNQPAARPVGA
jgi:acyl carrier protein